MSFYINTINSIYEKSLFSYWEYLMQVSQNQSQSSTGISSSSSLGQTGVTQLLQQNTAGFEQGMNNANQGVSLVQTAAGGLEQILNVLDQMNTLASEGASGVYSSTQLGDMQTQFSQLQTEVNNIANETTFNGISLLQNSTGSVSIQVAPTSSMSVNLPKTDTTTLNIASNDISTSSDASAAMSSISNATNTIFSNLAQLGASQISLQNASTQDSLMVDNLSTANAYFDNNNFALTSPQNTINMLMAQSSILMLAQANTQSSLVLQLLSPTGSHSSFWT